jgi:hypothetical protein
VITSRVHRLPFAVAAWVARSAWRGLPFTALSFFVVVDFSLHFIEEAKRVEGGVLWCGVWGGGGRGRDLKYPASSPNPCVCPYSLPVFSHSAVTSSLRSTVTSSLPLVFVGMLFLFFFSGGLRCNGFHLLVHPLFPPPVGDLSAHAEYARTHVCIYPCSIEALCGTLQVTRTAVKQRS